MDLGERAGQKLISCGLKEQSQSTEGMALDPSVGEEGMGNDRRAGQGSCMVGSRTQGQAPQALSQGVHYPETWEVRWD